MNKETCKNLYQKYLELKLKTHLEVQELKHGQPYKLQNIDFNDLDELKRVKNELEYCHCLEFLSDDQLIAISEDDGIGQKVKEILKERRI